MSANMKQVDACEEANLVKMANFKASQVVMKAYNKKIEEGIQNCKDEHDIDDLHSTNSFRVVTK